MIESSLYSLIELVFCVYFAFLIFLFLLGFIVLCCECDHHHDNNDALVIITTNPDLLRLIPVVEFNFKDFKHDVECIVCLSELVDGDKVRVLPNCNHLFHADCIGSWLRSHLTCPICRKRVCPDHRGINPQLGGGDETLTLTQNHDTRTENPDFPTHSPRNTETVVVEDVGRSGENEGPPDLTAVVIDIPAKEIARISNNI